MGFLQKSRAYARTARTRIRYFFSDFKIHPQRYVAGELPELPFADDEFDLTLVSYLLFAYQERFDYEFHRDSILEIMRVTRGEARIYPTVTFEAKPSEYIPMLQSDPALRAFEFTEVETDFEFLVNSNSYSEADPRVAGVVERLCQTPILRGVSQKRPTIARRHYCPNNSVCAPVGGFSPSLR